MGYISALETVSEGIMCALGYDNYFSGMELFSRRRANSTIAHSRSAKS